MEVWKRALSLMLALALAVSCLPGMSLHIYAAEIPEETETAELPEQTEATPEETEAVTVPETEETVTEETVTEEAPELLSGLQTVEVPFQLNPLYEGILDESDFDLPQIQTPQVSALSDYLTVAEAVLELRGGLKSRMESIVIYFECESGMEFETLAKSVFAQAVAHTGAPTEGDYLAWQYAGWKAGASYSTDGTTNYYTTTYTVVYYTTPEQEAELDAKVTELLSTLNLSGKSNYEKLKGIYDYICANITYDYANLSDSSYTLKYTAYAALINKTAVCQGYSLLLYRLALELGVDCRLISGTGNGGGHGWNIVRMDDGLYYNVDSTWDTGRSSYSYFLKCDDNFSGHTRGEDYASEIFYAVYPMGTADYVPGTEAPVETTISQEAFAAALEAANAAGESYTLTKELTLTSDLTAGFGCGLTIAEGGSITVPEGVVLRFRGSVNGGTIQVENGGTLSAFELNLLSGSIKIADGGLLYNEFSIDVYGGTLSVASGDGYSADQYAELLLHLDWAGGIQGIDPAQIKGVADISDTIELIEIFRDASSYGSVELLFNTSFTLEQSISIPENTQITTQEDTVLTIPSGVNLTLNSFSELKNEIIIQNGGTLSIQNGCPQIEGVVTVQPGGTLLIGDAGCLLVFFGSLNAEAGSNVNTRPGGIQLYMNGLSSITGVEKALIFAKTELFSQDETPLMDYLKAGADYFSFELSLLDYFVQEEDVLVVPDNCLLSLNGFIIPEGKTVINYGTIDVSVGELYVNGTLDNQGRILVCDENQLVVNGTMTGNAATDETGTMTQEALQALLDEAAAVEDGMAAFEQAVVLTDDLEIPANVTVDMVRGGITVSEGTTLTVNGSVSAYNYPKILVKDGGCLKINGSISLGDSASITVETGGSVYVNGKCTVRGSRTVDGKPYSLGGQLNTQDGALVQINGTLSAAEGAVLAIRPGTITTALSNAGQVTGMDSLLTVTSAPGTCEDLISFAADGAAYGRHEMTVDTDITLTQNVSIPRNTVVTMTAKLTVPEGKSLTNAGDILLNAGSELLVQAGGTLTNRGTITENGGKLTQEGTLIDTVAEDLSNVSSNAESMSADEIRSAVQDMDPQELAEAMENNESALANIAALEQAAGGQAVVQVEDTLSISAEQVSIVGANLNTAATDEAITLVIGTAEKKDLPVEYDSETAAFFSMELTNVEELTVPVKITLPIPDGMDPEALVILHYHGDGEPEVLKPTISEAEGKLYASIVLTSFSDFAMAQRKKAVRGDFDGDYALTVDDAAELLWDTIFEHSIPKEQADFNGDQKVDEADVVYLLWHILFPDLFPLNEIQLPKDPLS